MTKHSVEWDSKLIKELTATTGIDPVTLRRNVQFLARAVGVKLPRRQKS